MLKSTLVKRGATLPLIKGVIQGSMVMKDAILERMTFEDWTTSVAPKVQGSWNLHARPPQGMDFFLSLSSVAGVVGSGGQANYAAGDICMDSLAHYRVGRGEKATSLELGWMVSEGAVAESSFLSTSMAAGGSFQPISQAEFSALLHYCNPNLDTTSASAKQEVIGLEIPASLQARGLKEPHRMQRWTFRHLHGMGQAKNEDTPSSEQSVDYAASLREASSLEDAGLVVMECLLQKLSKSLSMPRDDIDTSKSLHAYGVDSLLAVELRSYFAKELSADVDTNTSLALHLCCFEIQDTPASVRVYSVSPPC